MRHESGVYHSRNIDITATKEELNAHIRMSDRGAADGADTSSPLSRHRVPTFSAGNVYYIPDFISQTEEDYLINKIRESPRHNWKQLSNRRLQVWGESQILKERCI
ncbi:hypothetical protein HGRIS_006903 [Hohenbuehelia grisea]|uniref:Uncharacterized protein n=1 Tax=Hohenbuehelia grisea TaxID=104357 RepID=A0ABR3JBZ8_9AGAR